MPTLKKTMMPGMLLDEKIPLQHRRHIIHEICQSDSKEAHQILDAILKNAAKGDGGRAQYLQKKKECEELIEALENGPPRLATFMELVTPATGTPLTRAHVKLEDGTSTYPVVTDASMAPKLRRGDAVLISARSEAVLRHLENLEEVGEEARLEDWLGDRIEVSQRTDERHVLHVTHHLRERLERGEVEVGAALLVCLRRRLAIDAVPRSVDELAKYRFLTREPVPDVDVERDVGDPPAIIDEITRICRLEIGNADLRRRYHLRRCLTVLFAGVSGSGKSLCIAASIRRLHEVMAEMTGVPLEQLPPRVIRLRMSKLLSQWLGQSDKNADLLVDEIVALADERIEARGGKVELPVIVVMEEIDGIARQRGLDHDGVYDRIQATLLQRLDHTTNRALRDKLIFLFATTNVPHLIDPAWIRRVGGRIVRFGRLRRRGFAQVLDKQLGDRPLAGVNGSRSARRAGFVRNVTTSVFGADDPALVEIQLAGATAPTVRRRRDFLTGSLVDRAVQRAADAACEAEAAGHDAPGLTEQQLVHALDEQIEGVVRSLTTGNVGEFVDLPDGVRVASVRRLEPATIRSTELQR